MPNTSRCFSDLTYKEISICAEQNWLVLIPTGCTEQQGPHLPVDFDTWFSETLMLAAAEKTALDYGIQALVLPAMPFGPTPEHRNFGSGFIDLPVPLHNTIIEAILRSLVAQGFRRLVLWRGCGGHDLREIVERFNQQHQDRARAFLPPHHFYEIWCSIGDATVSCGHADSFTTSISLYLRPESVRLDQIVDPHSKNVDWDNPQLDFTHYSTTGVIGDPTHASAELGEKLWKVSVEDVVGIIKDIFNAT